MDNELNLSVMVDDPQVILEVQKHAEGPPRQEFINRAFRLGVLALKTTSGEVDILRIQYASKQLIDKMREVLDDFFNHDDGKFPGRIRKMLDGQDGDLVNALRSSLSGEDSLLGEPLKAQRDTLMAEFSLEKKDSALSKLVSEVKGCSSELKEEFSLDKESSALNRMLAVLEDRQTKVFELLHKSLGAKEVEERTPIHGIRFEDRVCKFFIDNCAVAGDYGIPTGNTVGSIPKAKVGDFVIEIGEGKKAAGTKIVVEAKEKENYTFKHAKEEIQKARKNRDASIGIFVFSSVSAPKDLPPFQKIGNDIFVCWDAKDPLSEVVLIASVSVARAIASFESAPTSTIDFDKSKAMGAVRRIESELGGLAQIITWSNTIKTSANNIRTKAERIMENVAEEVQGLDLELKNA